MKILTTGDTGFLGSALTRAEFQGVDWVHLRRNSIVTGSTEKIFNPLNLQGLLRLFDEQRFDGIIHMATHFAVTHSLTDFEAMQQANLKLGMNLLEASCRSRNTPWFLNLGTTWQNRVDSFSDPVNLYAATKQAFEDIMQYYLASGKVKGCTLRISDQFGPFDKRGKLLTWLSNCQQGVTAKMSDGSNEINALHVSEVLSGMRILMNLLTSDYNLGYVYFVAAPESVSLKKFVLDFLKVSGLNVDIDWGALSQRARQPEQIIFIGNPVPSWEPSFDYLGRMSQFAEDYLPITNLG